MQHRREVRVIVVEGVRQGTVHKGGARGRIPLAPSYDARLLLAAPAFDQPAHDPGRLHPARREGYPDDVGSPPSGILEDLRSHVAVPHASGEPGYLLQQGSRCHRCTSASGRTGEPVPPTILSGARTNTNSCTPAAASPERFMTSIMWMPCSARSRR